MLGLRHFTGQVLHSSAFQTPKEFHKSVLVVGGGLSGNDIASVLTKNGTCKSITVSVRKWKPPHRLIFRNMQKSQAVTIKRGLDSISMDGTVHFKDKNNADGHDKGGCVDNDGDTLKPDVIIFCTGYRYWYPFLPNGKFLSDASGYKMNRLYMRVLHIDDPSLAFIGVTNMNLTPPIMFEYQSKWYAKSRNKDHLIMVKWNVRRNPMTVMSHRTLSF